MKLNKDYIADSFYTEKYNDETWLKQMEKVAYSLINRIKDINPIKRGDRILDAGCGSGDLGRVLINKFNSQVYGIDMNKVTIQRAKKTGLKVKMADLDAKWPFENNFFNVVIGSEVIEHVVNPDNFLAETKRVLKKDGLLILTTPNLAAWFNRVIFLFGFQPFFTEVSTIDKTMGLSFTRKLTKNREPLGHIRCFTLRALKDILDLHGFRVILVKGSTVYYFPKFMKPFDYLFSYLPDFSTNLTIVARKK